MTKKKKDEIDPYWEPPNPDFVFIKRTEKLPYHYCVGCGTEGSDPRHNPSWNQLAKDVSPYVSMEWVERHYVRKSDLVTIEVEVDGGN